MPRHIFLGKICFPYNCAKPRIKFWAFPVILVHVPLLVHKLGVYCLHFLSFTKVILQSDISLNLECKLSVKMGMGGCFYHLHWNLNIWIFHFFVVQPLTSLIRLLMSDIMCTCSFITESVTVIFHALWKAPVGTIQIWVNIRTVVYVRCVSWFTFNIIKLEWAKLSSSSDMSSK